MDFENKEKDISWDEAEQKLKKAFDFAAFLGTEELDDKVTDVMDGKDLLEPDAFDRFSPDYVPRRGGDPERGRHEAPGQDPEPMEFVEEEPEPSAMDPNDPRYAAPERPRVLVAGQRPTVYITPEGDYDSPDDQGPYQEPTGGGEGKSWLVAVVITLAIVAAVLAGVIAAVSASRGEQKSPAATEAIVLTPAPQEEGEDAPVPQETGEPDATPVPTEEPEETPEPTEPPVETYTILVTAGTGGSIRPSGTVEIQEGEDVTFTLYPDEDYEISQLIIDGESEPPAKSYTFENVKDDHTIYAVFVKLATVPPATEAPTPTPEPTAEPTPEPTAEPTPVPTEPPAAEAEEEAAVVAEAEEVTE